MSFLKSLVLASVPKNETNPTIRRRDELVRRLEEQKSLLANSNYVRVSTRCQIASNRDPLFASNSDPSGGGRNGLIRVVHRRDPRP